MKEENYLEFEDYLSNSLSAEEIISFKEKLQTDPEFKDAFETYREISGFLEQSLDDKSDSKIFENNLKTISDNYFEKEKQEILLTQKSKPFKIGQLAVAASIAILLGFFVVNTYSKPDYNDYSDHETISLSIRGNTEDLSNKAQNAFNTKDFEAAEIYFTQILNANLENTEVKLYKAISQIEQDKFIKADTALSEIASGKTAYKNEAIWYAALSKLKQQDEDACLFLLKKIPEDADTYKKAQKLIDKLD